MHEYKTVTGKLTIMTVTALEMIDLLAGKVWVGKFDIIAITATRIDTGRFLLGH